VIQLNDRISGVVLAALGAVTVALAQQLPPIPGQQVGPSLLPSLIGSGLVVCGLLLMLRVARAKSDSQPPLAVFDRLDRRGLVCVLAIPAACVIYIVLADRLGFVLTATLILLLLQRTLRVQWLTAIVIAVVGALAFNSVFAGLLRVPLPGGILTTAFG